MTRPMARVVLQIQTRLPQTQSDGLTGNEPSCFSRRCGVFLKPTREANPVYFAGHWTEPIKILRYICICIIFKSK